LSTISILKQDVVDEDTGGISLDPLDPQSFLRSRSPSLFSSSPFTFRKACSLRDSHVSHHRDDDDTDCVQRALLSSYQRLDSERLRRRVVLSWAAAITPKRLRLWSEA